MGRDVKQAKQSKKAHPNFSKNLELLMLLEGASFMSYLETHKSAIHFPSGIPLKEEEGDIPE